MSVEKNELKKLTHDAVFGKITPDIKPKRGAAALPTVRLFGIAMGYIDDVAQFGPYVKFKGDFEGLNFQTGEVFVAESIILPTKDEAALLKKAVDKALSDGHPGVAFAFDYSIAFSEKGSTGYTYLARESAKPRGADPLATLRVSLPAAPKALSAPKK